MYVVPVERAGRVENGAVVVVETGFMLLTHSGARRSLYEDG